MNVLLALLSFIKDSLFKKDEANIESKNFNAIKVSACILFILACVFNIVAIKTIGTQMSTIKDLNAKIVKYEEYKTCMTLAMNKLTDDVIYNHKSGQEHLLEMKYCK